MIYDQYDLNRKKLFLEKTTEPNLFMTALHRQNDVEMAAASWRNVQQAMQNLLFTNSEMIAICSTLAAIYHLGVAGTIKSKLFLMIYFTLA